MRSYVVGGAVRDQLLGLPVQDRDHVVVGATPEQMLAAGFRPVGKDFPVFLHPETQEEYALARTERKTARGYHGFAFHAAPDVTLEQDLVRRDLTINAMALGEDGELVDPYGGRQDLRERVFRHVSDAFAEDPVRILRLARFAARLPDFSVADSTLALMRRMVEEGEADALVPERVWQELARGLMEKRPSRMFEVLRACGALARILPELDALWERPAPEDGDAGERVLRLVDAAAGRGLPLALRFAVLVHELGPGLAPIQQLCKRLRVPNDCRDLALMTARERDILAVGRAADPEAVVALFERCDAFRKPERFAEMLLAATTIAQAGGAQQDPSRPAGPSCAEDVRLLQALGAARAVNAGEIAARLAGRREQIPEAVRAARIEAVRGALDLAS
ncbi:multifunctional CCA tRNA nucleotidyl transferase/2'3'-cyclic phosphodiesterase/2'nucleotidase/phosphatase [Massilia sp. KIM]|uniref:multifunctional CCA tRNA nucleotidyl transferase/2'3'-cyclic phosphodiesterase/2'nucleotidase/phosphatase n=1 Tax=Massilia sp. KIM TaxID=1955422 RepID=UPI00099022DD|nr:multifunctional CCA tRNA nucleotidyl transferase/2'3'-cyclic phosphodiesterase/2'nucleotidase/phosphatase [Massilia sp. KIM]OON60032.1 multifunctional CCA tRNA nucleotidyl transferase/2'3'-cyclic phosphodiesterase/2'nucleotidase/phosphatase [Massilia sp. KIM]